MGVNMMRGVVGVICLLMGTVGGVPFPQDGSFDANGGGLVPSESASWISVGLLSIGSLIVLISVLALCGTQACFKNFPKISLFGRRRPMSFDNPVAEMGLGSAGTSLPLSQIDVRALQLDPVVFEPLPTIHDLSPLPHVETPRVPSGGGDSSRVIQSPPLLNPASTIVPFAPEDSELFAHDWFDEQYRNFKRNNLELIREVGRGWFGEVLEAEAVDIVPYATKIRVLVKRLKQEASQIDQMRFLDECRIYRDADQGNILKLLGHSIEKLPFLLILEYWAQGDLKTFLIANVTRAEMLSSQGSLFKMGLDIAKGLEWLMEHDFKHPDLATRNCQMGSEGRIIIGDYGLATQTFKDDYYWNSGIPIPLRWAAPETVHATSQTLQTLKVTKQSNLWSFAVVLWEIFEFGKLPYFELSDEEVITKVLAEKSYFLGPPTLPYIPFPEELYEVMRSCWTPPNQRPPISKIITKLNALLEKLVKNNEKDEEFESKWERVGRLSSGSFDSPEKKTKTILKYSGARKSVSFSGIENLRADGEPEDQKDGETESRDPASLTLEEKQEEEDAQWIEEMDKGGVSLKIKEKSPSFQDFMVLTHVEPSDIHGPESLLEIGSDSPTSSEPNTVQDNSSHSKSETSSPSLIEGTRTQGQSMDSNENDPSQEPPAKFFSSSSLLPPEISIQPATPIEICDSSREQQKSTNQSSPHSVLEVESTSHQSSHNETSRGSEKVNATAPDDKLVFSCVEDPLSNTENNEYSEMVGKKGRLHSTPRSPYDKLVDKYGVEILDGKTIYLDDEDVFNLSKSSGSCSLSPISVKNARGARNIDIVTTVVGASDDLGLEVGQAITTFLHDRDPHFNGDVDDGYGLRNSDSGIINGGGHFNSPPNFRPHDPDMPVLARKVENWKPMSWTPHPDADQSSSWSVINSTANDASTALDVLKVKELVNGAEGQHHQDFTDSFGLSTSNDKGDKSAFDVVSLNHEREELYFEKNDAVQKVGHDSTAWEALGFSFNTKNYASVEKGRADDVMPHADEDVDDFLVQQMQSLSTAAGDTKSLFQLCLQSETEEIGNKFVEDIQLAQEELGSLVLEDLEDGSGSSKSVTIAESHSTEESLVPAKLAFYGPLTEQSSEPRVDVDHEQLTTVTTVTPLYRENVEEPSIDDTGSGPQSLQAMDFTPSTWNQNLAPVRPAIKSPGGLSSEAESPEHRPTLRKSVSFENKKKKIVYKYPPPPPVSDEEDENLKSKQSVMGPAEQNDAKGKEPKFRVQASLADWDLTQEELESTEFVTEDSDEDVAEKRNPMDMYRISGFDSDDTQDAFQIRASSEPFSFSPTSLGELRHTRNKLKLDLPSKGEASILDDFEPSTSAAVVDKDSGVGSCPSTTNTPPFNSQRYCDDNQDNN